MTIRNQEPPALIKILFFGAGAVVGSKILNLPGLDNLAAAREIVRRGEFPVTHPCNLMFIIEDPLKGTTRIKMGIARKGETVIRDLD